MTDKSDLFSMIPSNLSIWEIYEHNFLVYNFSRLKSQFINMSYNSYLQPITGFLSEWILFLHLTWQWYKLVVFPTAKRILFSHFLQCSGWISHLNKLLFVLPCLRTLSLDCHNTLQILIVRPLIHHILLFFYISFPARWWYECPEGKGTCLNRVLFVCLFVGDSIDYYIHKHYLALMLDYRYIVVNNAPWVLPF